MTMKQTLLLRYLGFMQCVGCILNLDKYSGSCKHRLSPENINVPGWTFFVYILHFSSVYFIASEMKASTSLQVTSIPPRSPVWRGSSPYFLSSVTSFPPVTQDSPHGQRCCLSPSLPPPDLKLGKRAHCSQQISNSKGRIPFFVSLAALIHPQIDFVPISGNK